MLRPGAVGEADLAEYLRTYAVPGHMSASFDYYRALKADVPQFRAMAAHKLPMPVLAIGAERGVGSGVASFRPVAEHLREVIIPASGHHIPDDQPQALAQVLGAFFAEP
jgi:pimeloyl-ACP methyl ester carboxylesterase